MARDLWFDLETPHEIVRVRPGGVYIVRVPGDQASDTLAVLVTITRQASRGWDEPPTFVVLPDSVTLEKLERPVLEKLAREAGLLPPAGDPAF